jgi:hypothetical protein
VLLLLEISKAGEGDAVDVEEGIDPSEVDVVVVAVDAIATRRKKGMGKLRPVEEQ